MLVPNSLLIDIDGVLLSHPGTDENIFNDEQFILPGVLEKLSEWRFLGHTIILTSARPESMRDFTIKQLEKHKIIYNVLLMNLPHGRRYLLNDMKEFDKKTAIGISIPRDEGLINVSL